MSKDKAREFWIDKNWALGACDEMHLCVYDKEVDGIRVIEYAAYTDALKMLEEMAITLELYAATNDSFPEYPKVAQTTLDTYRKWKEGAK